MYDTAVVVPGLAYAEGLRWHEGALWFSDMLRNQVLRYSPATSTEVIAHVRAPSGIGFAPDGAAYVVSRDDEALIRVAPGPPEAVVDLAAIGMQRANDMVVDVRGRAFIGCLGKEYTAGDENREWDDEAPGKLAFLDLSVAPRSTSWSTDSSATATTCGSPQVHGSPGSTPAVARSTR